MKRLCILLAAIGMMIPVAVCACTSVIISGSASPDGRPLMWKHRDTGFLDNRLEHFKGEKYSFIGLVNSEEGPLGREVWIGTNTAGFSIMNTASYCLKNDDVPASEMDREGVLMYRALEICADLSDFEHFLDTLSRPMGVEANFGCIDAFGGAAYYETWNDGYVKRDVTGMEDGYCVVTNFSVTGRKEDWKGVERYRTASEIFASMEKEGSRFRCIGPDIIMNSLSRSYKHQGDSLYIPRAITSASVVIQGVKPGESPERIVFWTALGHPSSSAMVPVPLSAEDHIPGAMKKSSDSVYSHLCDLSNSVKYAYIFPEGRKGPMDLEKAEWLSTYFAAVEKGIYEDFSRLYSGFAGGAFGQEEYLRKYDKAAVKYVRSIEKAVESLKF
ncbi:MAG: hypothetical protein IKW27_07690 [Bacteroidales bacterium]|nr:hypothetical protein [Bacteroidales bacterium]